MLHGECWKCTQMLAGKVYFKKIIGVNTQLTKIVTGTDLLKNTDCPAKLEIIIKK